MRVVEKQGRWGRWRTVTSVGLWAGMIVLCGASLVSCSGDSDNFAQPPSSVSIIDATRLDAWRITSPSTVIGSRASSGEDLYRVRGVVLAADDRIIVGDGGDNTIRLYDEAGNRLITVGGTGEAPGEFQSLWSIHHHPGDSIAAFDLALRRISVYDGDLRFGRSFRLPDIGLTNVVYLVGIDRLGKWYLFEDLKGIDGRALDGRRQALNQSAGTLWVLGKEGQESEVVGEYPGTQVLLSSGGGGIRMDVPLFGRVSTIGVAGHAIITVDSTAQQVELRDLHGTLTASVRPLHLRAPLTQEDRDWFVANQVDLVNLDQRRQLLRAMYRSMPEPVAPPEFGRAIRTGSHPNVVAMSDGALVRRYERANEENVVWYALDEDGTAFGWLRLPKDLELLAFRDSNLAGVQRDADGVETVVVVAIARS